MHLVDAAAMYQTVLTISTRFENREETSNRVIQKDIPWLYYTLLLRIIVKLKTLLVTVEEGHRGPVQAIWQHCHSAERHLHSQNYHQK